MAPAWRQAAAARGARRHPVRGSRLLPRLPTRAVPVQAGLSRAVPGSGALLFAGHLAIRNRDCKQAAQRAGRWLAEVSATLPRRNKVRSESSAQVLMERPTQGPAAESEHCSEHPGEAQQVHCPGHRGAPGGWPTVADGGRGLFRPGRRRTALRWRGRRRGPRTHPDGSHQREHTPSRTRHTHLIAFARVQSVPRRAAGVMKIYGPGRERQGLFRSESHSPLKPSRAVRPSPVSPWAGLQQGQQGPRGA